MAPRTIWRDLAANAAWEDTVGKGRMYSIFAVSQQGKRKVYKPLSSMGLPLESARRIWQDALMAGLGELRAIRPGHAVRAVAALKQAES
jgi:hypothetical protein